MAEAKTKLNDKDPKAFIESVKDEKRKADAYEVLEIMTRITGEKPKMWGTSIIGFGSYHYKYASGREGDWMMTGFSPRKTALTLYIMPGYDRYGELMGKLGKHKTGKSCLYINKLEDVNRDILVELIKHSVEHMRKIHK
tara:strand:- start:1148 stop:1564 length:417 start_codon:yes stop_codon:yes gene_type:complete